MSVSGAYLQKVKMCNTYHQFPDVRRTLEKTFRVARAAMRKWTEILASERAETPERKIYLLKASKNPDLPRSVLVLRDEEKDVQIALLTKQDDLKLGSGSQCTVMTGVDQKGGLYAVKVYKTENQSQEAKIKLKRELSYYNQFNGRPFFIKTRCILYSDTEATYVVQKYCPLGDLFDVISSGYAANLGMASIAKLMRDICCAVNKMHEEGVLHGDLKVENVLIVVGERLSALLSDFGFCRPFPTPQSPPDLNATVSYAAPEFLLAFSRQGIVRSTIFDQMIRTSKSAKYDMWSLGILFYICLTGCDPYFNRSEEENESNSRRVLRGICTVNRLVLEGQDRMTEQLKSRLPMNDPLGKRLSQLVLDLLVLDPEKRLSAEAACRRIADICVDLN